MFQQIFESKEEFDEANFFDYLEKVPPQEFFNSAVKTLIGATNESSNSWLFYSGDSIYDLVKLFTSGRQHRALVVDEDILIKSVDSPIPVSASLSLISQSDLISYIQSSLSARDTKLPSGVVEPLLDTCVSTLRSLGGSKVCFKRLLTSVYHGTFGQSHCLAWISYLLPGQYLWPTCDRFKWKSCC